MKLAPTHPRGILLCWLGWFYHNRVTILAIRLWCKWGIIKDLSFLWYNVMIPRAELLWCYYNCLQKRHFNVKNLATLGLFLFFRNSSFYCSPSSVCCLGRAEEQYLVSPLVWKLILLHSAKRLFSLKWLSIPSTLFFSCLLCANIYLLLHYHVDSTLRIFLHMSIYSVAKHSA